MAENPAPATSDALDADVLLARARSLALETAEEDTDDRRSLMLFRIGDEWYAVGIESVREILQAYEITPIPCTPEFILGVTNVRGEILSVTDPAALMSMGRIAGTGDGLPPAMVVSHGAIATSLVVDEIGDIVEVGHDAIEPPLSSIDRAQAEFVAGTVHANDQMVGLLNVERVLEPIGSAGRH